MIEYDTIEDEKSGLACKIYYDDSSYNPRRDMYNLCKLVAPERDRYIESECDLGLDWCDCEHDEEILDSKNVYMWRPIYRYEHGGVAHSMGSFNDPWDSGQVGYIIALREDVEKEWGKDKVDTPEVEELVLSNMRGEIQLFSDYCDGQVYGFRVVDPDECTINECWGFFGADGLREIEDEFEAACRDYLLEQEEERLKEHAEANPLLLASGVDVEKLYEKEA